MTDLLTREFDSKGDGLTLVAVHGTGGRADEMLDGWSATIDRAVGGAGVGVARLVCPQFETPYQFLLPDADARLLDAVDGPLHVFGFSGGAQFAHRLAQRHPDRVAACAALAAGAWTHPDGSLHGMMIEDGYFERPEFADPAVRAAGERPAAGDVTRVRWLVGCGTRDLPSRYNSARAYHATLGDLGCAAGWVEWDGGHDGEPAEVSDRILRWFAG